MMSDGNEEVCRLCRQDPSSVALEPDQRRPVKCFGTKKVDRRRKSTVTSVAEILNKYFWFELNQERDSESQICQPCWTKVDTFHQFWLFVESVYAKETVAMKVVPNRNPHNDDDPDYDPDDDNIDYDDDSMQSDEERLGTAEKTTKVVSTTATGQNKTTSADQRREQLLAEETLMCRYFSMKCDLCDAQFDAINCLLRHQRLEHRIPGSVRCCGIAYYTRQIALEHCRWHEKPGETDPPIVGRQAARLAHDPIRPHRPPTIRLLKPVDILHSSPVAVSRQPDNDTEPPDAAVDWLEDCDDVGMICDQLVASSTRPTDPIELPAIDIKVESALFDDDDADNTIGDHDYGQATEAPEAATDGDASLEVRLLRTMDAKLDSMRDDFNSRLDQLLRIVSRNQRPQAATNEIVFDNDIKLPRLPLTKPAQVALLNEQLQDCAFEQQMVLRLKTIDKESTVNVRVRKFMEALMTYDCVVEYSWSGKSSILSHEQSKHSFQEMVSVRSLIRKALQYQAPFVVDEDIVKASIHDFFRRATTRKQRQQQAMMGKPVV